MKKLLLSKVCALSAIAILTFSCKKEEVNEKVKLNNKKSGLAGTTVVTEAVYVAGYNFVYPYTQSKYWVNGGTATNLTSSTSYSTVGSIAISELTDDVYISGAENIGTSTSTSPKYWKNGVGISLPLPSGATTAYPGRVYIKGSDVYILANALFPTAPSMRAMYWKINSSGTTSTLLGSSPDYTRAANITVIGTDVYVSGTRTVSSSNVPVYWKNGVEYSIAGGTLRGNPAIASLGADLYIAVAFDDEYHLYKNGTEITSILTGGPGRLTGSASLSVAGTDVYFGVSGSYSTGTGENRIFIWKNSGSPVYVISKGIGSDGLANTNAAMVATPDGNVYVSGRDHLTSCYWRNGVKTNLPGGSTYISGIAILYY